jgi:hypothetical protein
LSLLLDLLDSDSDKGSSSIMLKSSTKAGGDREAAPCDGAIPRDNVVDGAECLREDVGVDDDRLVLVLEGRRPRL